MFWPVGLPVHYGPARAPKLPVGSSIRAVLRRQRKPGKQARSRTRKFTLASVGIPQAVACHEPTFWGGWRVVPETWRNGGMQAIRRRPPTEHCFATFRACFYSGFIITIFTANNDNNRLKIAWVMVYCQEYPTDTVCPYPQHSVQRSFAGKVASGYSRWGS